MLKKLTDVNQNTVFVNPNQVTHITSRDLNAQNVHLVDGETVVVSGRIEEVAAHLRQ